MGSKRKQPPLLKPSGGRKANKKNNHKSQESTSSKEVVKVKPVQETDKAKEIKSGSLTREEICDMIAELSESILGDPTKAFSSPDAKSYPTNTTSKSTVEEETTRRKETPSYMKQLLQIASYGGDEYTSQLGILSLLAIYRDILPSYRIRLPSEAEMAVKVSLETKRLWDYERALLTNYQQYLKLLENIWKKGGNKKSATASTLTVTCMLCMCELIKSAFHFNFRSNLLSMIMRQINNGQCKEVSNACCAAVEHIFKNDAQGEIALEATRLLAKAIRDRGFKVRAPVLRTFLSLPLRVHTDEAEAAKLATAAKKRKRDKDLKEIDKELQEGEATVDKILLARCQSDTLQTVTLTYFRILKSDNLKTSDHMKEILPTCLEGLAKFAHLINIDTVMDLLGVLKELLKDIDALPLNAALNCVLTAFQTLSGPGKEMQIDQKEYISPLYTQLPRLISEASHCGKDTETMLRCLDAAFIKRREYSTTRVAAFLKQILTVAMFIPASTSIPMIAFARQLLSRYPAVHQMLENEEDAITSGQYSPDVEEPELANPFSTSAWEAATLKFHANPAVAQQGQRTATLKMLQMPGEDVERLLLDGLNDEQEVFIKFRKTKKRHPLEDRGKDAAKKRRRVRFIHASGAKGRNLDHLSGMPSISLR